MTVSRVRKLASWPFLLWMAAAFAVGLLAFLPATAMDLVIRHASKDRVEMVNPRGTLWAGEGDVVVRGKGTLVGHFAWAWQPRALVDGKMQFAIHTPGGATVLSLGIGGLAIERFRVVLPVEALSGAIPEIGRYGFQGVAEFAAEQLTWSPSRVSGKATCDARNIGSPIARVNPLGSYRLELVGEGDAATVTMGTLPGSALVIEGRGAVKQGVASFQGAMSPAPPHREVLAPFLSAIGGGSGDSLPLRL